MTILVFGQQRWGGFLARQLNRYGRSWRVTAVYDNISAPEFRIPSVRALRNADVVIRVGYPVGSPTIRGRAFDAFWSIVHRINRSALYMHYWIGTDVQSVVRYSSENRLRTGVFERYATEIHAVCASRLANELRPLDIGAVDLPFDGLDLPPVDEKCLALPSQFTVLTYIPNERWAFYGGNQLIAVATRLPRTQFVVVGGNGKWLAHPLSNVSFLGWRNDMVDLYGTCSAVLRLAQHDAVGGTVIEGLAMGRHVIYNYPVPFTTTVDFDDTEAIIGAVKHLEQRHESGTLELNLDGRRWALANYDEDRLIRRLCEFMARKLTTRRSDGNGCTAGEQT